MSSPARLGMIGCPIEALVNSAAFRVKTDENRV